MSSEEWRDIPGYEGLYEVSSLGHVRSLDRVILRKDGFKSTFHGQMLKSQIGTWGYPMLDISKNGIRRRVGVHVLVARAFIGAPPLGHEVRHMDDNKKNPRFDNLEYGTRSENQLDRRRNGTSNAGERNGQSSLTTSQVKEIKFLIADNVPQTKIAARYHVCSKTISNIKNGRSWLHV